MDQTLIDILTVADSFSAIMEPRVYKNNVSAENTFEIMNDETNEKNKGLNKDVIEHLKYLINDNKINLKGFF